MATERLLEHLNSEGERISIERCLEGPFAGQFLLILYDDPPSKHCAPMLLDQGTQKWLVESLGRLPQFVS